MKYAGFVSAWLVATLLPLHGCGEKPATTRPASVAGSMSFGLQSAQPDETFQIDVAWPLPRNTTGAPLPVVYVLDGNGLFAMVTQIVRVLELGDELPPLLIVGVGYSGEPADHIPTRRMRNLTPSVDSTTADGALGGGAAAFLAFINTELKPAIAQRFDVDTSDSTLVGNSLGGLFALHTLFNAPGSFTRYVAGSPALWWDDGALFRDEQAYAMRENDLRGRLFMGVGALEKDQTRPNETGFAMVTNVERLTATLRGRAYPSLHLETVIFPAETHLSVVPAMLSRGLRSVFSSAD